MRFQKRVRLMPGVRLNLSKSGVSVSVGAPGATMNIGAKGISNTLGIPGSGLSWTKRSGWQQTQKLSSSDELRALLDAANNVARPVAKVPETANAAIARADKAMESYRGGRGATESKLATLTKRLNTELEKLENLQEQLSEAIEFMKAIEQRLSAMTFGFFSGSTARSRDSLLSNVREMRSSLTQAADSITGEVSNLHARIETAVEELYGDQPDSSEQ